MAIHAGWRQTGTDVFMGEFQHTLDTKNRLILPARFRDRLASGIVMAPSQDRALDFFPSVVFERQVEALRSARLTNAQARAYLRVLLANAHHEAPDSQGRITIPERLRAYARLEREVTVTGYDEWVQVWDRSAWDAYRGPAEADFSAFDGDLPVGL